MSSAHRCTPFSPYRRKDAIFPLFRASGVVVLAYFMLANVPQVFP